MMAGSFSNRALLTAIMVIVWGMRLAAHTGINKEEVENLIAKGKKPD